MHRMSPKPPTPNPRHTLPPMARHCGTDEGDLQIAGLGGLATIATASPRVFARAYPSPFGRAGLTVWVAERVTR